MRKPTKSKTPTKVSAPYPPLQPKLRPLASETLSSAWKLKACLRIEQVLDLKPVELYLQVMKTTIELPDAIVHQAKVIAAERRTTLRELVLQGLEHVLAEKQTKARDRAKKLFAEMDRLPEFAAKNRLSRSEANAR